jgi:hypothetical protein
MAAPIIQAEGALAIVTSGDLPIVAPAHDVNDILVVSTGLWAPNTSEDVGAIAPDSLWSELTPQIALDPGGSIDGRIAWFWRRATGPGTTCVLTRPAGCDTGIDTCWGGRAYVIRGVASDEFLINLVPFDEVRASSYKTAANQSCDALDVRGPERTAIQFLVKTDDFATAPTLSGWTAGVQVEDTTGTDHSQGSFRQENVSVPLAAAASTVSAPAAGAYAFCGVSFRPPPVVAEHFGGTQEDEDTYLGTRLTYDELTGHVLNVLTDNHFEVDYLITISTPSVGAEWEIIAHAGNFGEDHTPPSPFYKVDEETLAGISIREAD